LNGSECSAEKKKYKEAEVAKASTLWVAVVNDHAEFGRWAYLEIRTAHNRRGLGHVARS